MVVLMHTDSETDASILSTLRLISTFYFAIEELATGASREVHGQVALTLGGAICPTHVSVGLPTKLHYQIRESTVDFFPRGTSNAVL